MNRQEIKELIFQFEANVISLDEFQKKVPWIFRFSQWLQRDIKTIKTSLDQGNIEEAKNRLDKIDEEIEELKEKIFSRYDFYSKKKEKGIKGSEFQLKRQEF